MILCLACPPPFFLVPHKIFIPSTFNRNLPTNEILKLHLKSILIFAGVSKGNHRGNKKRRALCIKDQTGWYTKEDIEGNEQRDE